MYQQTLDPIGGSLGWSAAIAAIPLLAMFAMLGLLRWKAHRSALIALVIAIVIALVGWGMPVQQTLAATGYGALYGLFPILWILINALFVYRLTVVTGYSEILGRVIRSVSDDQRILSIVIAFCFGALLESLAGFGAPVAISAAMLLAAGMKPLKAAMVSLLANTAPVAFGAMGAPIIALAGVTRMPLARPRRDGRPADPVPRRGRAADAGVPRRRQARRPADLAGRRGRWRRIRLSRSSSRPTSSTVEITDVVAAIVTLGAVLLMLRRLDTQAGARRGEPTGGSGGGVGCRRPAADRSRLGRRGLARHRALPDHHRDLLHRQIPSSSTGWPTRHHDLPLARASTSSTCDGKPLTGTKFKLDHLKATGTLLLLAG